MEHASLLAVAVPVLVVALAVVLVCLRLRVAPVAGLLVAGALIGPSGLGWLPDVAMVHQVADLGVMLLLFGIGLELSRDRLRGLGRALGVAGPLQTLGTAALAGGAALALGVPPREAVVLGWVVCLSSTALVLKIYGDRNELGSLHGRTAFAILIFQDLLIVPLLLLVPVMGGADSGANGGEMALRFFAGVAVLAAVVAVGRKGAGRVLRAAARGRSREASVLGALTLCLGLAWVSERVGLSPALGAFLGGFLLAESEFSHQALADVLPLREVFASLFFVSVGMLLDLDALGANLGVALGATGVVVLLKATAAALAVAALGVPRRTAMLAGLGLAQVGEFSFVLLESARGVGVVAVERYQLLLSVAALSMLATPALISVAPWLVDRLFRSREGVPAGEPEARPGAERGPQVLVVGYGVNGEILARILHQTGIRYVVLDADPLRVARGRAAGEPIHFGDATRREVLESAGAAGIEAAVLAISDPGAVRAALRALRALAPRAQILIRTRHLQEIEALERLGATRVVAEEYETAIEIYTWVLERFHVPRNVVRAQTRVLRGEDYRMLRESGLPTEAARAIGEILAAGTTDLYRVSSGDVAVGRTLADLDLRRRTGATVLSVVRDGAPVSGQVADHRLDEGDTVVLVGAHAEIDAAFALLAGE
ncbi:MAG: cation:proton antiporter [Holophagales bacterium]|nr:cation:proton antiporter [Holophagales bacterium]